MEKLRFYFYFILLASPKQTNRQTNRKNVGRDTETAVANYSGPRVFIVLHHCPNEFVHHCRYFKALPVEVSTGKWQCLPYSSTSSRISQVIDSPQDSCPAIIPVEVKNWYGSACVHHDADMGFSARDREEADQWLDEVQYSAEVSPTVTFDTGRSVNKETQVQSNCTNYTRKWEKLLTIHDIHKAIKTYNKISFSLNCTSIEA